MAWSDALARALGRRRRRCSTHRWSDWRVEIRALEDKPRSELAVRPWFEVKGSRYCLICERSDTRTQHCSLAGCGCQARLQTTLNDGREIVCCDAHRLVLCRDWPEAGQVFAAQLTEAEMAEVATDPELVDGFLAGRVGPR